MQLAKKDEPFNFEQLLEKLQKSPFNSTEGKELLIKLMTEPGHRLPTDGKEYTGLQDYLFNENSEIRRLTYIAVCLAILRDKSYWAAGEIASSIEEQSNRLNLDPSLGKSRIEKNLGKLDHTHWQALGNALREAGITSLDLSKHDLTQLNETQWQAFCDAIKRSEITSLVLCKNNLGELNAAQWQIFCTALQTSKITTLNVSENDFGKLTLAQWQAFCDALQRSQVKSLRLDWNNGFEKLDPLWWQLLYNALQGSKINSLTLGIREPWRMGQTQWEAFSNTLQAANITSLTLNFLGLEKMDKTQWKAFSNALRALKTTSLRLNSFNLWELSPDQWQVYCNALEGLSITSLNLSENGLGKREHDDWQIFCTALQTLKITSLDLSHNDLDNLTDAQWQAFCNMLQGSMITNLSLFGNNLGQMNPIRWEAFCKALQASKITTLNLGLNNLEQLNEAQWQIFGKTLKASKITSLNLKLQLFMDEPLQINDASWQALCDAIRGSNIRFLDLGLAFNDLDSDKIQSLVALLNETYLILEKGAISPELPAELQEVNDRNRFLQQTTETAAVLLNSKSKQNEKHYPAQIDKILADLDKNLLMLRGKDTPRSNAVLAELRNYLEDLQYKKASWCRDQAFFTIDNSDMALTLLDQARDAWMSISPESKHFEEARHQLFQLVYHNVFPDTNAHEAFKEALPYLVNENNQLIDLSKENQKVFDHYLFAAAGGKGGLEKEFTPEQRLTLLQYILLSKIKQLCEKKEGPAENTPFFKTQRHAGLRELLNDLSLDTKDLNSDTQIKMNNLWTQTYNRLETLPLDNDTKILALAINQLALPSPQPRLKP